jgi:hypothetical protein
MTERRYRTLFLFSAGYLLLATVANAIAYAAGIDTRELAFRSFDFGWELGLPWRAARGEWVGRDFSYPIGPLWQLIALVASGSQPGSLKQTLTGIHIAFPLLSFAICAAIVLSTITGWKRRVLAFVLLAMLAGFDDAKSLRAVASLAIVIAYVPSSPEPDWGWKRPLAVGALLAGFTLLSFEIGFLGLSSLVAAATFEAVTTRKVRVAAARLGRSFAAIAAGTLVLALFWALIGGSLPRALAGWLEITRAYGIAMIEDGGGVKLGPLILLAIATLLLTAAVIWRERDRTSAMWLGATLPLAGRAVVRTDAEHIYAGLMPLIAVLVLLGSRAAPISSSPRARAAPRRLPLSAWALLIVAVFSFAWFGSHRQFSIAWHPVGFRDGWRALSGGRADQRHEVDIVRIQSWITEKKRAGEELECVGVPERASVVHPLADVPGPTATQLRWTPAMREQLASEIERRSCPYFVREIVSFDFPAPFQAHAFGQDFLAVSRLYERSERIGPSLFVAKLRSAPASFGEQRLELAGLGETREVSIPGALEFDLPQPIPADRLLLLDYTLDVPWLSRVVARLPWVHVLFADDQGAIGESMALSGLDVDRRASSVVPVHPEIAEWRWVAGSEQPALRAATRISFRFDRPALGPERAELTLHAAKALAPPDPPHATSESVEIQRLDLLESIRSGRRFARGTRAAVTDDALALPPNEAPFMLAEVYVPVRPAAGSCLFAELGVEGATGHGDGVWFEIHVIDGADRPRLLHWHNLPGFSPRPAELPLERWAGRDVLLRFGTAAGKDTVGDDARIYRPRIGPCATRLNLMHAFHDGRIRAIRGAHEVLGDTLRLEPSPKDQPPTEVRFPLVVEPGSCLALDMRAEGPLETESVAIDAGILDGRVYDRLAREEIPPGAPPPLPGTPICRSRFGKANRSSSGSRPGATPPASSPAR